MANTRPLVAQWSRLGNSSIAACKADIPRPALVSYQTVRHASGKPASKDKDKKKRKTRNTFRQYDLKHAMQFSLIDAMHYIRAFEVGQNPASAKYEMHIRLSTLKNGPVIRNRLRLPHPVKTDFRICVIAPPDSKAAADARAAGAALVGEDDIFEQVKNGVVDFERCICHTDSLQKLNKAGLGRFLGPKGLMPSAKTGTVVKDVGNAVKNMVGGSEYRERMGVIRMAVGQLGFTPDEMQRNITSFMDTLKKDIAQLSDRITKDIHEVVLSSTHGPGLTLNGEFKSANSIPPKELAGPL
ncbi:ribosomal protein L1 [Lophiostoma macrostomum CBS 122681]|uniref:Ribosomal protein L1 n=1 Tax=Lophiostoma macrostomum CBS 122681 TaxID=1314788 RepID=A0A6A6SKV8_9PLEO|nr:ribosomal protein L1 [Lophiostoma macrostomum CBS 122681]